MADSLETWYAAFQTRGSIKFFQMMTFVDLDLFYGKIKIGLLVFCIGNSQNNGFFWFWCSVWHQSWFMQSAKWTFINTKGQCHLLTVVLSGCLRFVIFNFSKTAGLIEAKLHLQHMWDEGMMFVGSWSHDPRWPLCPYMVQTLWKAASQDWKANDFGTWYAALGTQALPSLCKWWPLVDLDLF